jgi:hypothetical protein
VAALPHTLIGLALGQWSLFLLLPFRFESNFIQSRAIVLVKTWVLYSRDDGSSPAA